MPSTCVWEKWWEQTTLDQEREQGKSTKSSRTEGQNQIVIWKGRPLELEVIDSTESRLCILQQCKHSRGGGALSSWWRPVAGGQGPHPFCACGLRVLWCKHGGSSSQCGGALLANLVERRAGSRWVVVLVCAVSKLVQVTVLCVERMRQRGFGG